MDEYIGGGGCKGTHPVQGQVREEQLLVTVPPELLAGPVPQGAGVETAGSGLDLDIYAAAVIAPPVCDADRCFFAGFPLIHAIR